MSLIEKLLSDLKSPVEEIRLKALMEVIKSNDLCALPALKDLAVNDESVQIRYYAKKGLHFIKNKTGVSDKTDSKGSLSIEDEFEKTFTAPDEDAKINLVQRAVKLNLVSTVPLIEKHLAAQNNPFVKSKLIIALGILGKKEQIDTLKTYLNDPDYRIKANTIEALGYIGHRSVYPIILSALGDSDNRVRANAIKIINKFGKSKVSELLDEMIQSDEVPMVMSAIDVIAEIKRLEALPLLKKAFEKNNPNIRGRILNVLANLSETIPEAADLLDFLKKKVQRKQDLKTGPDEIENIMVSRTAQMLKSSSPDTRLKGIAQCFEVQSPSVLDSLKSMLENETDPYVKAAGVNALGRLGRNKWANWLERFLKDPDNRTRANTVEVLGALRDPEIARKLIPMLKDSNNRVRANAVMALWDFSEIDVFPVLQDMVKIDDPAMCQSAIFVIMDIEDDDKAVGLLEKMAIQGNDEVKTKALESLQILKDSGIEQARKILEKIKDNKNIKKIKSLENEKIQQTNELESSKDAGTGFDIERVIFDLESETEKTRQKAARILESIGDENCLAGLQNAMKDPSNSVRYYAGKAFNAIKRRIDFKDNILKLRPGKSDQIDTEELKRLLTLPDKNVRISAIQQVKITDFHALQILVSHLPNEADDFVKPALVSCIGMLGDDDVVPLLLPFLHEKDSRVRANTIEALEYTCSDLVFPHIVPMLQDTNNRVKANAIKALQNAGKQNALNMLAEMTASDKVWMRDSAAYALGTIKDPVSLNILIDLFDREKDIAVAAKAINSISMVITKSSFPLVIALKDRTREEAKKRLIQALETKLSGKKVNFYSIAEEYSGLSRAAKTPKYQIPGQDTGQSKNLKPSETKKKAPSKVHGIALKLVEKALDSESGNTKASKTSDKGGSSVNSTKADDIIKQDIVRQEKVKEDIVTQDKVKEDIVTQDKVKEEKVRQDKVTQDKVTEVQIKEDQIVGPDSVNKTVDKGPDQAKNLKKIDRLIQKLAADLKSSDEEDRKRAVTGLSKIDSPKVIPYLEEAAKDSETIVKFIAKKALKSVKQNKKSSDDSKKNEKNSGFSKKSDLNKLMPFAALFALIFLSWAVYSFFPLPFGKDEEQPDTPDVIENNIKKPVSAQNALQKNPVEPSKDTALVKELKNLLKTNNSDVIEALKWGNFNARKKKYSKAVDDFKKALDIEPDNLEAGLKYIYCLKKTGSQRRAMAFFDKRKNSSKAAQFLYTLAGPSMNTALLEIEKMINNNPSLFFADITAAYFEAAKKNYLIAADLMMKVYEDFNENIHLLIKASEFYLSGGNTEKALEILNRPDFDDDTKKIYSGIGKVNAYIKLGRLSGAVSEAENLMTKNPLNPEILYKMGKCRFQQKRFQEACDYLNRSIALNSSNYKAQYLLAQALDFTGQHKEALKLIKSASMLDPECQETWIAAAGGTSQYVPPRIHGDDEIFLPEKTASNIDPELFKF